MILSELHPQLGFSGCFTSASWRHLSHGQPYPSNRMFQLMQPTDHSIICPCSSPGDLFWVLAREVKWVAVAQVTIPQDAQGDGDVEYVNAPFAGNGSKMLNTGVLGEYV